MSVDVIGNFLTIIRNGIMASKPSVVAQYSKINVDVARILKEEGFIGNYSVVEEQANKKSLKIVLKYVDNESVIHEIKRISTPGCRFYANARDIRPVIGGLGVSILTTNRGIITNKQAKELGIGGEVICTVW